MCRPDLESTPRTRVGPDHVSTPREPGRAIVRQLGSELDAEAELDAMIELAGGDTVESFGDVDLDVEGPETVQFRAVFSLPSSPLQDRRCEIREAAVELGELRLVTNDVRFEPGDSVLDVAALYPVGPAADGAELAEVLLGSVASPTRFVAVALLAPVRFSQVPERP